LLTFRRSVHHLSAFHILSTVPFIAVLPLTRFRRPFLCVIHIILCDDPCKISICPHPYGHHCASSIFIIPCADLLSSVCAHRGYPCPRNKRAKSRVETGSKFVRKTAATMCSVGLRLSLKDPKNLLAVFSHYHKSQVQILSCSSIILLVWMDCLERFWQYIPYPLLMRDSYSRQRVSKCLRAPPLMAAAVGLTGRIDESTRRSHV